jgi:hypothetical protein
MASKIKPKRSHTTGAVPTTSDLDTHELAINWADSKAFTKTAAGNIVSVTMGGGGSGLTWSSVPTSATATGTAGQIAYDANYQYTCVATNTWKRTPLSTWFFDPRSIVGIQLWLDAADSATLFDATTGGSLVVANGGVARWEDKSGQSRHATQSTSGNRPLRKTGVQSSRDVLRFDGTNDFLQVADFLDLTAGQSMTIIAAIKRSATNAYHTIVSKYAQSDADDDNTADGWVFRFESANQLLFSGGINAVAGNSTRVTNSTVDASAFTILSVKVSAGAISGATLYRNSSTVPSSAIASGAETLENTSFPVLVGALMYTNNVPLHYLNGDVAEIIIYDTALSDANRELVESYLVSKWGIV